MADAASATVVGLPPDSVSPGSGGGPTISLDGARAKKRESDREAKRRQREREKNAARAPDAETTAKAAAPDEPRVEIRFKNRPKDARIIEVEEISLERLADSACSALASATGDGRFFLLGHATLPNGKTLAADIGFAADNVLALHGIRLTPEATVYAQLVVSLSTAAMILGAIPKMTTEQAAEMLPNLQSGINAAMGAGH